MPRSIRPLILLASLLLGCASLTLAQVGAIDTDFGYGGTASLAFEETDVVLLDSAIQRDGKIVVTGYSTTPGGPEGFGATLVARYLPNGRPDFTLGGGRGFVEYHWSRGRYFIEGATVALDAEGRIVVGGALKNLSGMLGLMRLNPDGSLDDTFRGKGQFLEPMIGTVGVSDIEILPDGSIVAVSATVSDGSYDFAVLQFDPDGAVDVDFGEDGGRVTVDFDGGLDAPASVAADAQGRIVVAGRAYSSITDSLDFGVVRLLPDGSLDASFGDGGLAVVSRSTATDQPAVVKIQEDGMILVAGTSTSVAAPNVLEYSFAMLRLRDSGRIDTSFGRSRSGWVTTDIGTGSFDFDYGRYGGEWTLYREYGLDLAMQFDGKIVLVGSTLPDGSGPENFQEVAVLRYTVEGDVDPSFGVDGALVLSSSYSDEARTVSLQRDGRIVIAGPSSTGGNYADNTWDRSWGFLARIGALEAPLGDLLLLIDDVEQLLADGRMEEKTASALLRSLEGAIARLQAGDPVGAGDKIDSFLATVDREAKKGGIYELEVADWLTASGLDILAQLAL